MAFDAFLKFSTIPGESTDDKHKDWIEVLSFHWGVVQPKTVTGSSVGAQSAARADFMDLSFVHALDCASPKLFLACAKGEHIPEATLQIHRATGEKQKYMEYKLTDVMITRVAPGGSSQGEQNLPLEEVSINFIKGEEIYTKTNHKTGKPEGDVKTWWDRFTNKGG